MEMVTLFAIGSILLGIWTFLFQQRRWETFKHEEWDKLERFLPDLLTKKSILQFQFRQFRRRCGISALLIVIGVLFPIGWFMLYRNPRLGLFLVLLVMLLLTVVVVLAIVDAIATYFHYAKLQRVLLVEQAKWKYHEKRLREELEAQAKAAEQAEGAATEESPVETAEGTSVEETEPAEVEAVVEEVAEAEAVVVDVEEVETAEVETSEAETPEPETPGGNPDGGNG